MSSDANSLTYEQLNKIRLYLKKMIEHGGSDLHVKANAHVRVRVNGKVLQFSKNILSKEEVRTFAKELLRERYFEFVEKKELDLVYAYDEQTRFRVNIFYQIEGISAVLRLIPMKIPQFDQLKLPKVLKKFIKKERGLVLVTGATGSGKSTTLASLIHEINQTQKKHILTIEDPVEFVHKDSGCIINQRSVGQDTVSYSSALRAALREDPDIILVGEMRDQETINLALHAADTGHLVFSTLHTIDAKETINRIISTFPTNEQNRIRISLASVLQGIVSQRLIPTKEGGRRAAMEILVKNATIEKLIIENRDYEIQDAIEAGKEHYESQSFDQAIIDLYNENLITKELAKQYATSASDMELQMSGVLGVKVNEKSTNEALHSDENDDIFGLK